MKTFNKQDFINHNTGDLTLLEYIKTHKIDTTKNETRKEFLNHLFKSILALNFSISDMEQSPEVVHNYNEIYNVYIDMKLALLKELNIPTSWLEEERK